MHTRANKNYQIDAKGAQLPPSKTADLSEAFARFLLNPSTVHYSELRRLMYVFQQLREGTPVAQIQRENDILDEYEMQALAEMME